MDISPENSLWVEKYRPKTVDEMVLPEDQKTFFEKCIKDGIIPQLLFIGHQGSGKTALARILVDHIIKNEADVLCINGSDDTGIQGVREDIVGFLKSPAMFSKIKIVYIDEADYLSKNAQAALRNIIERFSDDARFIFTANYKSKIIDPLHSRFQTFEFERVSEDFCLEYCTGILDKEELKYDEKDIKLVIKGLYPDIRKIVNTLQRHVLNEEIKGINASTITTNEKKLVGLILEIANSIGHSNEKLIVNTNIPQINKLLYSGKEPEYNRIYEELNVSTMPPWAKIKVNRYANEHVSCAIPPVHFSAMILDIIQAGKEYIQMFGA